MYQEILKELESVGDYKTKDVDTIVNRCLKDNTDVSDLLPHVLENWAIHKIYFHVNLLKMKNFKDQLSFIEEHFDYLNDWYHTDELIPVVRKYSEFEYAYSKAKKYVLDKREYVRRWGYVMFLSGIQKTKEQLQGITKILKNDDSYTVSMGEAWLICDLCVFNPEETYEYLKNCDLKYNIVGKAISKINDSFRISDEFKEKFKALREERKKLS